MTELVAVRPPVTTGRRALAPDLARGGMLLLIAVAHAPLFVSDVDRGPAPINGFLEALHLLLVHNHARPLFAFLFGYALVQLLRRHLERGGDWVGARKLLRRRGWWLTAIGFVHVALLVPIDILAVYGIAGVLTVGLLRAKDRTLLIMAGVTLLPATVVTAAALWLSLTQGWSSYGSGALAFDDGPWLSLVVDRLAGWPIALGSGVVIVIPAVILGSWAARRRVLDEPAEHRPFLVRAAVATTVASILGALPAVLINAGGWPDPGPVVIMIAAVGQALTGYAGGIGLAMIIALIAIAAGRRVTAVGTAVQALGQRSLSLYLFQSVVFVVVFAPYGLGLGDRLGLTGATVVAVLTWLLSLIIADVMRRARYRGPAEILLRRLSYRPSGAPAPREG